MLEKSFTFIDVETPNKKNSSISSIALIHITKTGEMISKYYLVNPDEHFDEFNIELTGIKPIMVRDKDTFDHIWKEILIYFEDSIIVGHNVGFDLNVIHKCLKKYDINFPKVEYICTLDLSRKYINTSSYKLNQLCNLLDIDLNQHHNAKDDTKACYKLFNKICTNCTYDKITIKEFIPSNSSIKNNNEIIYKVYNSLYGILLGISFDEKIDDEEVLKLNEWLMEYKEYKIYEEVFKLYSKVELILEDNVIEFDEFLELINLLREMKKDSIYSDVTLSMQVFMGILKGIVADEQISEIEAMKLKEWMLLNDNLKGEYPYEKIYNVLESVLEDNIIDKNEHSILINVFNEFLNPKTNNDNEIEFEEKTFCLTGTFEFGTKQEVMDKIIALKGIVSNGVNKKVDYVVVGGAGSENYKFGNYGSKVKKALEMQEKGSKIKIISEEKLLENL